MANYLIQPQADHTANPTNLTNAVFAFGVADPGTVSGLANGTAYVAREFVLSPASAAFTPAIPATAPAAFQDANWSVATGAGDSSLDVTISTLPDDGGEVIKDVEYDVDAGGVWTALPSYAGPGAYTITMPAGETSYAIRLRAVNAVGAGAAGNTETATSSAASLLPFTDDFSTDTSATWEKFLGFGPDPAPGFANLVVANGEAASDGTGNGTAIVMRDLGLGPNCRIQVTRGTRSDRIMGVHGKVSNVDNEIRLEWSPTVLQFRLEIHVNGSQVNAVVSSARQTFILGDIMELEIYNNGNRARAKKSSDGGATFVTLIDNVDVSVVPPGSLAGFRVDDLGSEGSTITRFWADNV